MARIRTIKPEFFTSEDIVNLTPLARLLYISLWCESDREGRFSWKPKTFKMRYFPGDSVSIEKLCDELRDAGLVLVYVVNDMSYGFVPTFHSHQHINPREAVSQLPEPPANVQTTRASRVSDASARVSDAQVGREGKGREGKEDISPAKLPTCPIQEIIDSYHAALPELPSVKLISDKRTKAIQGFWKFVLTSNKSDGQPRATGTEDALEWISAYFYRVRENAFLMGKIGRIGEHAGWQCDLDYLLTERGMTQVIEKTREAA